MSPGKGHVEWMEDRRTALAALGLLGAAGLAQSVGGQSASPAARPSASTRTRQRSVRDFGAHGDGRTDDTDAFNAATEAAGGWSEERGAIIRVPAGRYRVNGTIRLRKGQHLTGDGEATVIDASGASGTTLAMGQDARGRRDPGGAPVGASGLRFLGGTGQDPVILVDAPGFSLSRLFLSSAGTAIMVRGADGTISDVVVDQALRGLVFSGAQNVVVHGLITYLANFALALESGSTDIIVADALFNYSRYASVLFAEGASNIRAIRFGNCGFVSNEAFSTFLGHVHVRSGACDAHFANCTFRNWPGYAVRQQAGSGARLTFNGCVFDGSPSRVDYGPSPSAGGILTGAGARFDLSDCHFSNLRRPVLDLGPDLQSATMNGGSIRDCIGHPLVMSATPSGSLAVRGVDNFGLHAGGAIVLPWRGATTAWRLTARTSSGDGAFLRADCIVAAQGGQHVITLHPISQHGALSAVAFIGERPGGPQAIAGQDSGYLCVAADRPNVRWAAEELT